MIAECPAYPELRVHDGRLSPLKDAYIVTATYGSGVGHGILKAPSALGLSCFHAQMEKWYASVRKIMEAACFSALRSYCGVPPVLPDPGPSGMNWNLLGASE